MGSKGITSVEANGGPLWYLIAQLSRYRNAYASYCSREGYDREWWAGYAASLEDTLHGLGLELQPIWDEFPDEEDA